MGFRGMPEATKRYQEVSTVFKRISMASQGGLKGFQGVPRAQGGLWAASGSLTGVPGLLRGVLRGSSCRFRGSKEVSGGLSGVSGAPKRFQAVTLFFRLNRVSQTCRSSVSGNCERVENRKCENVGTLL